MNNFLRPRAVGLLLVLLLGVVACQNKQQAPDSTFVMLDRSSLSKQDLLGKVWLVNFWATSCATCVEEMPELIKVYETYQPKGLEMIAVAMQYDPPSYVVRFQQRKKLPFKVALDNTGVHAKAWGDVSLTPTTYVINKSGEVVQTIVGAPDFPELERKITALLEE